MAYSLHSGINATFFADNPAGGWAEPTLYYDMVQDYSEILPPSFNLGIYYNSKTPNPVAATSALAGGWDNWLYHARGSIAPITFELYRNASSVSASAETIIIDNSTHRVIEWTEIYGYFTPESDYIQALWEDVKPGFFYLLDNTPSLQIDIEVTAGWTKAGNKIGLDFGCINWSPRLSTVENINVQTPTGFIVASANAIPAASNVVLSIEFLLSSDLDETGLELKIGNEFAGYTHFTILNSGFNLGLVIGLSIAGLVVVAGGITTTIFLRRRR